MQRPRQQFSRDRDPTLLCIDRQRLAIARPVDEPLDGVGHVLDALELLDVDAAGSVFGQGPEADVDLSLF